MAVTATVNSVTATEDGSGVISVVCEVSYADGETELGTRTYSTTITQRTVAARTALEQRFIAEINAAKATLASQQLFAAQAAIAKTNIQAGVN